jgi:hypothetical protein
MMFHVGQKVVCVNDGKRGDYRGPKKGETYTVREIAECPIENDCGLRLYEIVGETVQVVTGEILEVAFRTSRFRPLIERKSSTSTGFEILDGIRKRESVDEPVKSKIGCGNE